MKMLRTGVGGDDDEFNKMGRWEFGCCDDSEESRTVVATTDESGTCVSGDEDNIR
jgi:hypothetical protein